MTSKEFCDWLSYYLETKAAFSGLDELEVANIKTKLNTVDTSIPKPFAPHGPFVNDEV